MGTEDAIKAEIEEMGRLTQEQEDILYNISIYEPMIEREYLTYDVFNHGGKHEIACLYVTLKGLRYCIMFADELAARRKVDAAGAPRQAS